MKNEEGSSVDKTVTIKVQRDTDKDGTADVEDKDDYGDGVPDEEEIKKGTDPKDPNSKPETPVVTTFGTDSGSDHKDPELKPSTDNFENMPNNPNIKPEQSENNKSNNIKVDKYIDITKKGTLPQTGDASNVFDYAGILALSGSLLAILDLKKKKAESEE